MAKGGGSGKVQITKEERALAGIASQTWDMYQEHFIPMENEYMNRVDKLASPEALAEQRGLATASTQQSFGDVVHNALMQQKLAGADPSSGRWQETAGGLDAARDAALAGGHLGVDESLKDNHAAGLLNIAAMGSGQAMNANVGLSNVAQLSAQNAQQNAMRAHSNTLAKQNLAGTVGGFALGMHGNQQNDMRNAGMTAFDIGNQGF